MTKKKVAGWIFLLVLWAILSWQVHNDILIPTPKETIIALVNLLGSGKFVNSVILTVVRVLRGFLLSLAMAVCLVLPAKRWNNFRSLLEPIAVLTKTIPNISYMILIILWLGSEGAVAAVSFMILFPVFYNTFLAKLDDEDRLYGDVKKLYQDSFWNEILYYRLPSLKFTIVTTASTAASLGFKVGVMAEILGAVRNGVGRQMQIARMNLNTAGVLAWTLVIIVVSILFDVLFSFIYKRLETREQA